MPIKEESDPLDDYKDTEESDQGAPIYDEDVTWTPEDVDKAYIKLGDDCDDKKQTSDLGYYSNLLSYWNWCQDYPLGKTKWGQSLGFLGVAH